MHRRHRGEEREKRAQYWREQVRHFGLFLESRQGILTVHTLHRNNSGKISCRCGSKPEHPFSHYLGKANQLHREHSQVTWTATTHHQRPVRPASFTPQPSQVVSGTNSQIAGLTIHPRRGLKKLSSCGRQGERVRQQGEQEGSASRAFPTFSSWFLPTELLI